jgi:hypothetical protein
MQLAGGGRSLRAVRDAVDHQAAHAADALAAIVIERDRLLTALDQALVHHIQHFEERHFLADIRSFVLDHSAFGLSVLLAPDVQG